MYLNLGMPLHFLLQNIFTSLFCHTLSHALLLCCPGYCVSVGWMCRLRTLTAGRLFMLQHTGVRGRPVTFWLNSCVIWRPAATRWDPQNNENLSYYDFAFMQNVIFPFCSCCFLFYKMTSTGSNPVWCSWWKRWRTPGGVITETSKCEKVFIFTLWIYVILADVLCCSLTAVSLCSGAMNSLYWTGKTNRAPPLQTHKTNGEGECLLVIYPE